MDQKLDVDEIWRTLRPWGRYQLRQLSVMWMGMMPCVIHLMIVVFIGFRPRFICNVDNIVIGNDSRVVAGECHMNLYTNSSNKTINEKLTCNSGYKYDTHKDISFVTEWDLVCDNAQWAEVSQALVLFGQGFGGFIFTGFSDKFGRKPVHITSHICLFLLTMSLTVIPNYTVFAIARFFIGAMIEGLLLTCATQYVETLPLEWRFCAEVIGLAAWTTGIILVTPFAYLMRFMSWRYLQLVMSLLSVYSLVEYWLFDESLRWLMANGKLKEAERVIRKAARLNNLQFDDVIKTVKREMAEKLQISSGVDVKKSSLEYKEDSKTAVVHLNMDEDDKASVEILQTIDNVDQYQVKKYSMLTILKTRRILLNSIIIWITWITNSLTYYGLTLISASLTGDRFLNYFFLGAIEYISSTLEFLLLNR